MRVLGIDAATPPSSVALWGPDDDPSLHRSGPFGRRTDAWILGAVDELLAEAGMGLGDIDLVAATAGPGAFTGIRVGLATAMGLARGAGIPVTGVGTLEVMIDAIRQAAPPGAPPGALACIDARRGEVYALLAAVDPVAGGEAWGPAARAPETVVERLGRETEPPLALGTGLDAYPEIAELARPVSTSAPLALAVARHGAALLADRGPGGLPPPRPRYLRDPDARPGTNPLVEGSRDAPSEAPDR